MEETTKTYVEGLTENHRNSRHDEITLSIYDNTQIEREKGYKTK
jgi:hypothetical protein